METPQKLTKTLGSDGKPVALTLCIDPLPWREPIMKLTTVLAPAAIVAALTLTAVPAQAQRRDHGNSGGSAGQPSRGQAVQRAPSNDRARAEAPRQAPAQANRQPPAQAYR